MSDDNICELSFYRLSMKLARILKKRRRKKRRKYVRRLENVARREMMMMKKRYHRLRNVGVQQLWLQQ